MSDDAYKMTKAEYSDYHRLIHRNCMAIKTTSLALIDLMITFDYSSEAYVEYCRGIKKLEYNHTDLLDTIHSAYDRVSPIKKG